MVEIGKINTLDINRETENGVYLDGGELGEILMPQKFVTSEVKETGYATVFVYTDSEDRLVATTELRPEATVGYRWMCRADDLFASATSLADQFNNQTLVVYDYPGKYGDLDVGGHIPICKSVEPSESITVEMSRLTNTDGVSTFPSIYKTTSSIFAEPSSSKTTAT